MAELRKNPDASSGDDGSDTGAGGEGVTGPVRPVTSASPRVPRPRAGHGRDDAPVLPQRSADEFERGWGDDEDSRRDAQWYRRERPPHHE